MKIWVILSVLSLSNFNSVKSQDTIPEMILNYTGSSTIGNFIEDASPVFGQADFKLDTRPESTGGELAILEGRTDLAGIARRPSEQVLGKGVVSTLIEAGMPLLVWSIKTIRCKI